MTWMAWTTPTALFFASIGVALVTLTVWELLSPTTLRRGLLPLATTRGDRFFISLLSAAFLHLLWLALIPSPLVAASALSVIVAITLMRWG